FSPSGAFLIDDLCDRFEAAWRSGQRPAIEGFVGNIAEPNRGRLVRDLVALDLDYRRKAGESPSIEDYRHLGVDGALLDSQLPASTVDRSSFGTGVTGDGDPAG